MAENNSAVCTLCRRALPPEEIESGKTLVMGTMKKMRRACISHFYSNDEQEKRGPNYQCNMDVMAMYVVWAERQTTDGERYQEMHGGHSLSGRQALIVEDHPECAELLKMILEDEGCEVRLVGTGTAALQTLTSATDEADAEFAPDLVLLDLRLPDMNGDDLVKELRKRKSAVPPTVMLSADTPRSLSEAASRVGVVSLRKPFDFVSLFSAIAVAQYEQKTVSAF